MANTDSDNTSLASLQSAVTQYNSILTGIMPQYLAAKTKLATDQSTLSSLMSNGDLLALDAKRTKLKQAGKWGVKDNKGNYWFIDSSGTMWSGADANQEYINTNASLMSWDQQKANANAAIAADKISIDSFDNPTNGSVTIAQNDVDRATKSLLDFVPATTQGQADQAAAIQAAAATAAANQAAAASTAATATANEQSQREAATQQANIAAGNTETYIIIAVVLLVVIIGIVVYIKFIKKKAAA